MENDQLPANLIGAQVKRLREELQLTPAQLAAELRELGVEANSVTVTDIEDLIRPVSDTELFAFVRALKTDPDILLPRTPENLELARRMMQAEGLYSPPNERPAN